MGGLLFIFLAKYVIYILIFVSVYYFLIQPPQEKRKLFIFGGITTIISGVIAVTAGKLFYNPRPFVVDHFVPLLFHAPNNGFPSDHVLLASTVAVLFLINSRKLSLFFWILTFLIACGRVLVGIHHTVDVLGSMAIAIVSGCIAYMIMYYGKNKY